MTYFNLVDAARTASPPPPTTIHGGDDGDGGEDSHPSPAARRSTSSSSFSPSLANVTPKQSPSAAKRDSTDAWRAKLLNEMLRSELGFTTVVKASGVPGAGLGLFVEGSAPEGAVVAIYPVSFVFQRAYNSEARRKRVRPVGWVYEYRRRKRVVRCCLFAGVPNKFFCVCVFGVPVCLPVCLFLLLRCGWALVVSFGERLMLLKLPHANGSTMSCPAAAAAVAVAVAAAKTGPLSGSFFSFAFS